MVPTSASRGTLYAIGHKNMKRNIIRLILPLICLISNTQCNSNNEELQQQMEVKNIIENELQAKLPKSVKNINHMMISSFMFHEIGRFSCDESEFSNFIISNNFNEIKYDEIIKHFISNEYEKYFAWWKPDILMNVSSFSKNWEYRNDAGTLMTVDCLLIAGNEDDKKDSIIYFDVSHYPKW
jgi:hypothetical protein